MNWQDRQNARTGARQPSAKGMPEWLVGCLLVLGAAPFVIGMVLRWHKEPAAPGSGGRPGTPTVMTPTGMASSGMSAVASPISAVLEPLWTEEMMSRHSGDIRQTLGREIAHAQRTNFDAGLFTEVTRDWYANVEQATNRYDRALSRFHAEKPLRLVTVRAVADLQQRQALTRDLLKANNEMQAALIGIPERMRKALARDGEEPEVVEQFLKEFAAANDTKLVLWRRVCAYDQELGEGFIDLCSLLRAEWGRWKHERGVVVFQNPIAAKKYNALNQQLLSTAKEMKMAIAMEQESKQ